MSINLESYEAQVAMGALFDTVRSDIEDGYRATANDNLRIARLFIPALKTKDRDTYETIAEELQAIIDQMV